MMNLMMKPSTMKNQRKGVIKHNILLDLIDVSRGLFLSYSVSFSCKVAFEWHYVILYT